jgi:2',3'-cyclic-nucleotide 2'-phosphodiesterase (5'-nucleotidase family)
LSNLLINSSNQITFGDVFAVQPFGNSIVTLSLTGKQIRDVLEQQWSGALVSTNGEPAIIMLVARGETDVFAAYW